MYLITGATGNVGSNLVEQLLDRGEQVRVFVREAAKAARWGKRVDVAVGDFANPETFASAAAGVDAVYLMNGRSDTQTIRNLLAGAAPQNNQRMVFQSTILAGDATSDIGQMHHQQEEAVRRTGWRGKFLRPGAFMTNAYQWISTIKAEGVVYNAMGTGRYAPVAPEDIAAVAMTTLVTSDVASEVFEFTGGESVNVPEQVKVLSEILARPIRCVDVSVETAVQGMIRNGLPPPIAQAVGRSAAAVRDGRAQQMTDTIAKVTGKPAMTFATWARKNSAHFA